MPKREYRIFDEDFDMLRLHFAPALAALLLAVTRIASADVIFSDGTFNLSQYTESTQFTSGATGTFSQCASCGDPGTALDIQVTVPGTAGSGGGPGIYAQGFVNNTFGYDPLTQGTIAALSASVDKNALINYAGTFGNTFRPLIEQDGNYYLAAVVGSSVTFPAGGGSTGYLAFSAPGLTAADFQEYDFATASFVAGMPNFAGDSMLFGLAQITSSFSGTIELQYDNLSVDVASVPEPSSLFLLFGGMLSMVVAARTLRRS
ncbi:MAG: PEP-CTERM sorting domain-containing protein [Thiobacillaceae bacterium]